MSDIIPRKKAVPVQARRAETPVETIQIPGMPPGPPPQAGVTQNIIYVNVPAVQPAPPPQSPAAPSEIHVHNTNVYEAPRRKRREIGTSFFGLWALVFAVVAALASYIPPIIWLAKPIIEIGAASALIGFFGAVLLGRVGRGVPLFALLMCGVTYCMYLNNSGQLSSKYDHLRSMSPLPLPNLSLDGKTVSPAKAPSEALPVTVAPQQPAQDRTRLHDHSIFGDGDGTWVKPTPASPAAATPAPTPLAPIAATPPEPVMPRIDVSTATANLERVRTTAAKQMGLDYTGAMSAVAEAMSAYQDAKISAAPGSPELITASQRHLEADSRLNEIEMKLRSDPAVASAEAALKSAIPTR